MARARIGEIELEYEVRGQGDPLVLIMGLGAQMIFWDQELIDGFVRAGFQVIAFDHRDVGLSTRLDHLPVPKPAQVMTRAMLGLPLDVPYTLSDMAGDVVGLLDHLGIDRAHAVGVSMGGMLVQHLAIEHPARLRTMTSIMSTSGQRSLRPSQLPRPSALRALFAPMPRTPDQAADNVANMFRAIGGIGGRLAAEDEARCRDLGRRAYERGLAPRGFLRHFAAIAASGDRTERLRRVRTPALVIHGAEDPLVRAAGGRATAAAIPGSRYLELNGMAHFIPAARRDEIARAIIDHARRN